MAAKEAQSQGVKYRVQLDFSKEAFDELEKLQKNLNAASRAEVVRSALAVLRWATNHLIEGNQIVVKQKDGSYVPTEFPFLIVKKS